MADLSTFIANHPWVTFGVFLILYELVSSIGKIGRPVGKGRG